MPESGLSDDIRSATGDIVVVVDDDRPAYFVFSIRDQTHPDGRQELLRLMPLRAASHCR
jgi:hypothetical protein